MAHVARMNVTPVKSTGLHHPSSVFLGANGIEGDHRFLFLEADGSRISGAEKGPLLGVSAVYDPARERLAFRFPDGAGVEGSAVATGLPHDVSLYDRTVRGARVGGPVEVAVSAHLGREVRLVRVEQRERASGRHPVTLISVASVEDLGARGGSSARPDARRFRATIELDDADEYEEDGWSGRAIQVGDAIVRVGGGVPRCVLTTMDPDTGTKDFPTLHVLAGYRRAGSELPFGVYGDVERPGMVRVGDAVAPVEPIEADPLAGSRTGVPGTPR